MRSFKAKQEMNKSDSCKAYQEESNFVSKGSSLEYV